MDLLERGSVPILPDMDSLVEGAEGAPDATSTDAIPPSSVIDPTPKDLSKADLHGADFCRANLAGANLIGANLAGANLAGANLTGARLLHADLRGADLSMAVADGAGFGGAILDGASMFGMDLSNASLSQASMREVDLRTSQLGGARLIDADLSGADATKADLTDADLTGATIDQMSLHDADLHGVRMRGVRGFESADWVGCNFSTADFTGAFMARRAAIDENYLFEFKTRSKMHLMLYRLWWVTSDCGRSFLRWGLWTVAFALTFSIVYHHASIDYGAHPTPISDLYFSVVTLTTLGFGDVLPASQSAQALVMGEVLIGYVMLGGLMSIFATKMGRRGE